LPFTSKDVISLSVPLVLGLCQGCRIGFTVPGYLGQNEIRSAIDDA